MSALFHPCPFPSIKSSAEKREISYFSLELQCFFPGSEEGLPNARGDVDIRAMGMVLSPKVNPVEVLFMHRACLRMSYLPSLGVVSEADSLSFALFGHGCFSGSALLASKHRGKF